MLYSEGAEPTVDESSPTVRRRRLAAELRQLREDKGRSGESVARAELVAVEDQPL